MSDSGTIQTIADIDFRSRRGSNLKTVARIRALGAGQTWSNGANYSGRAQLGVFVQGGETATDYMTTPAFAVRRGATEEEIWLDADPLDNEAASVLVLAVDKVEGMRISQDGTHTTLVNISNLPTSSAGLATGTLWNNSGVLNVA